MDEDFGPLADEAIAGLIWHWGDAYAFERTGDGWFHATSKAGGDKLSAPSADQLRQMIRADYEKHPRPTDQGSL